MVCLSAVVLKYFWLVVQKNVSQKREPLFRCGKIPTFFWLRGVVKSPHEAWLKLNHTMKPQSTSRTNLASEGSARLLA